MEASFPHSQECTAGSYLEPDESLPRLLSVRSVLLFFYLEIVRPNLTEREREREENVVRGSERYYILRGGAEIFPTLKVPRQCPLVLLVEVRLRERG
jgi:hypothetical protein